MREEERMEVESGIGSRPSGRVSPVCMRKCVQDYLQLKFSVQYRFIINGQPLLLPIAQIPDRQDAGRIHGHSH
jgi:hypothetical protein